MNTNPVKKSPTIILAALLCALASSNALLLRQNLRLRDALKGSTPEPVRAGDKLPEFSVVGLRGGKVDVRYSGAGARRVFLYFTPTCPYCRQQFPYWREILTGADRERFEVIGVVSDTEDKAKLEDYLQQFGCDGNSPTPLRVALVPDGVRRDYKLTATPITLVISNDGTVEKAWSGRWGGKETAEASKFFGVSFSVAAR